MELPKVTEGALAEAVEQLAATLKKSGSLRRTFLRSMIGGAGTAIGATVIAAIVITALAGIFAHFGIKIPVSVK